MCSNPESCFDLANSKYISSEVLACWLHGAAIDHGPGAMLCDGAIAWIVHGDIRSACNVRFRTTTVLDPTRKQAKKSHIPRSKLQSCLDPRSVNHTWIDSPTAPRRIPTSGSHSTNDGVGKHREAGYVAQGLGTPREAGQVARKAL